MVTLWPGGVWLAVYLTAGGVLAVGEFVYAVGPDVSIPVPQSLVSLTPSLSSSKKLPSETSFLPRPA